MLISGRFLFCPSISDINVVLIGLWTTYDFCGFGVYNLALFVFCVVTESKY